MTAPPASDSRTDLLLAARGGGIKVLGTIFRVLGGLGVSVLITRLTGAAPFGHYYIGLTCAQMLSQVGALGLQSSVLRFIPIAIQQREPHWLTGILRAGISIPTIVGVILAVPTYIFAEEIGQRLFDDAGLASSLRIFAFAIPATALANSLETSLRAFNRVDLSTLGIDVGFQLPKLVLVALTLSAGLGVAGAAYSHIAALLTCSLLLFVFLRPRIPSRPDLMATTYRMGRLWKQSLPVYLTSLLRLFNGRLELLLLGVFSTASDVAIYAVALQIAMVGSMLIESLITVTMPLISGAHHRGGREAVRPLLLTTTRWCVMATLPYYIAVLLFAESILSIFGDVFVEGRVALLLLGAMPLVNSAAGIAAAVLTMTGNAALNTFNSIVYLVLTLALDLALIPSYGIEGAALAVIAATCTLNIIRTAQVRWVFESWPFDPQILKPIASAIVAASICAAIQWLLADLNPWIVLTAGLTALAATYFGCLILLGISPEDQPILEAVSRRVPLVARVSSRSN